MKLSTERLILLPCSSQYVNQFIEGKYPIGDHIKEHIKELSKDSGLYGWGAWFVIRKEDGKVIGDAGFKGKPDTMGAIEVGYSIIPLMQKKGYATEAVKKLVDWAFKENGVSIVKAECMSGNLPSIKVLEKLQLKIVAEDGVLLKWELRNFSH